MEDDTVVGLPRPGGAVEDDPLLVVLREGARQMLRHAIEAEVAVHHNLHRSRARGLLPVMRRHATSSSSVSPGGSGDHACSLGNPRCDDRTASLHTRARLAARGVNMVSVMNQ